MIAAMARECATITAGKREIKQDVRPYHLGRIKWGCLMVNPHLPKLLKKKVCPCQRVLPLFLTAPKAEPTSQDASLTASQCSLVARGILPKRPGAVRPVGVSFSSMLVRVRPHLPQGALQGCYVSAWQLPLGSVSIKTLDCMAERPT